MILIVEKLNLVENDTRRPAGIIQFLSENITAGQYFTGCVGFFRSDISAVDGASRRQQPQ